MNIVSANTGINAQIPYSGTIIKNDGTVLDGTYRAKFIIYPNASPTLGETALYEEIRNGVQTYAGILSPLLSINDGKFDILLGSQNTTGISSLNDDTLWLELQLDMDNNGTYEEIFSPRKRIGSALSAINSMKLVANGGVSTNTLSLDSLGNLVFIGDSTTERMRITGGGAITALALGGVANTTTPAGYDRVLLANSLGQFSQVNISTLSSGGSGWGLAGNNTTDAWNGSSGTRLGTTSAQPLVLATTNATAQDIRFFTGSNGANERMRILGNGNIGIGTTTPQARLDVAGGVRIGDDTSACTSSNVGTLRYSNSVLQVCTNSGWSDLKSNYFESCKSILSNGQSVGSGIYSIRPNSPSIAEPISVYCDMTTDGGGWTILASYSGADNEQPLVSNIEVTGLNPFNFAHTNLNINKKIALSTISTESIFIRSGGIYIKVNSRLFDATLASSGNIEANYPVTVTANNGATVAATMGWSKYNISGGGDFGITTRSGGFDHHSGSYRKLNGSCAAHILYSYSGVGDSDAGYDVNQSLGSWGATSGCHNAEGGLLQFYVGVR